MVKKKKRARSGKVTSFPGKRQADYGVNRFIAAAGGLVCCFLLVIVTVQFVQQLRLKRQLNEYHVMIEQAEARNEAVAGEIERLSDIGYIEVLARRWFGLVKPGDIVFQLED